MAQWLRRVSQLYEMYSPLRPLMAQWLRRVSQLYEMYCSWRPLMAQWLRLRELSQRPFRYEVSVICTWHSERPLMSSVVKAQCSQ